MRRFNVNQQATELAIQYGANLISQVSRQQTESVDAALEWSTWTSRLFDQSRTPRSALLSIWSLAVLDEAAPASSRTPTVRVNLVSRRTGDGLDSATPSAWEMNPVLNTVDPNPDGFSSAATALADAFVGRGGATETNFDRFYFLMQKYASTLPCTYDEPGVSLFQQWRMVAAVMALSADGTPNGLPDDLALVGLDFPGIQETVYTIASRGAGKSVRGRSAFVQLLVNAVVDRIVRELGLCRANVIVNAGGNALILAGWSDDLENRLRTLDHDINRLLLHGADDISFTGFQGDLSLALAWTKADWSALKYPCDTEQVDGQAVSRWHWYEKRLKDQLQQAKLRPFASMMVEEQGFQQLFGRESIHSNRYCAVCRRPENDRTGKFTTLVDEESEILSASQVVCPLCKSFRKLADSLGKRATAGFLNRSTQPLTNPEVWQIGLHAASGYWYSLADQGSAGAFTLALSPDDFPGENIDGFWPLATTTPRIDQFDVDRAKKRGDDNAKVGDIRDNQQLADDSPGTFKRLGVLKADVDDLGTLLVNGLGDRRSAALTATLSESLTLFFGGWLDKICAEEPFLNKVYVLYAGGDDLLIIGTWNVIPLLAQRIAGDFRAYTGDNPGVHLSAGISVIGGKEPLYAAVEAADKALKQAKNYPNSRRPKKDAITFIGNTQSWGDFGEVEAWQSRLRNLITQGAPKALLMTLLQIYEQYQDDHRKPEDKVSGYTTRGRDGRYDGANLFLGPWLWQMIYKLNRLSWSGKAGHPESGNDGSKRESKPHIQAIQAQLLKPGGVDKMAVSARWAQLVSRKKEEE